MYVYIIYILYIRKRAYIIYKNKETTEKGI